MRWRLEARLFGKAGLLSLKHLPGHREAADGDAVKGEVVQAVGHNEADQKPQCGEANDEGNEGAQQDGPWAGGQSFFAREQILHLNHAGSADRRNRNQEGKPGGVFSVEAGCHAGGDGATGATDAGDDRDGLEDADEGGRADAELVK